MSVCEVTLELLHAVLENRSQDAVIVCSLAGGIMLFNHEAIALHGPALPQTLSEFASLISMNTIDGRRLSWHELPLAQALRGDPVRSFEVLYERDGVRRRAIVNAHPLYGAEGNLIGAVERTRLAQTTD